jgi:hypothetical protein
MAGNAAKLKRIEEITVSLRKGLTRGEIVRKFAKIYKTSDRAIDNYIREGNKILAAENEAKESIRQDNLSENIKSEIGAQIASTLELDLAMSKIATGGLQVEEFLSGEAVLRNVTPNEMVNAARELYKRRGDYAPAKVAQTDSEGNNIKTINLNLPSNLSFTLPDNTDGEEDNGEK